MNDTIIRKIRKPGYLLVGSGLLVALAICAIVFFQTNDSSAEVDPLLAEAAAGYQVATVQVTDDGFVPDHIELKAGKPAKINFKKSTGLTCIKSLGSSDFDVDVPLNKGDNIVTLSGLNSGTYEYHCGMYMYYGTLTVN
ncbi:cupredoxin domain-containing protein [Paenibacillus hexagrammi]|uniref:Cupredoxin domain-containing protein n=1 Tax=Paenibacillus hexagrammi TaxID=2908839 RepID=A0ABY3SG11_9BACL|nr:cupredoxin domain-containing protein [Paenibacillus sp. YPD9-1]UJF32136.1 cupredoxin domain-containing protein [Paenibacillus sp. YPD9-1]